MKLYNKIAHSISDETINGEILLNQIQNKYFKKNQEIRPAASSKDRIVIIFNYHMIKANGDSDSFLLLKLTVKPCLSFGISLKITWFNSHNDVYKTQKYKPLIEDELYKMWFDILNQEYKDGV